MRRQAAPSGAGSGVGCGGRPLRAEPEADGRRNRRTAVWKNIFKGNLIGAQDLIKEWQFREIVFVICWVKSNKDVAVCGCKTANEKVR